MRFILYSGDKYEYCHFSFHNRDKTILDVILCWCVSTVASVLLRRSPGWAVSCDARNSPVRLWQVGNTWGHVNCAGQVVGFNGPSLLHHFFFFLKNRLKSINQIHCYHNNRLFWPIWNFMRLNSRPAFGNLEVLDVLVFLWMTSQWTQSQCSKFHP